MRMISFSLILGLVATSVANRATFSLGDVDRYIGSGGATPTLNGAALAFSAAGPTQAGSTGVPEDGIDIFISPELQGKIKDAMKANCQEVNDKCYQSVKEVISTPETELQSRATVGGVLTGVWALAYMISGMAYLWKEKEEEVVHWHIDKEGMMQVSAAMSASEVVVGTGTGVPSVTITPKPEPTTPTGVAPAITTFTSAVNGHAAGDVVIFMPEDLAKRMEEMIRRTGDDHCPAAAGFQQSGIRKRLSDLGAVICAGESILNNAVPGYAFADYLVVHPRALHWNNADAVRAMNTVMQIARDMAPVLQLDLETAASVGVGVFAVAFQVLVIGTPLGTSNSIAASMFSDSTEGTSCSATSVDECFVNCRFLGALEKCQTRCTKVTSCSATSKLTTTTTVPFTVISLTEFQAPTQTAEPPVPKCNMDEASGMPYNVFNGVYGNFCSEIEKDLKKEAKWMVNSRGNQDSQANRRRNEILARTPPPNPETYKDYTVDLAWTPSQGGASCAKGCKDAYAVVANSPCGHVAGEQNIMASSGEVDVGCGKYSWTIHSPPKPEAPKPPSLGEQKCHSSDAFGKHKDISKTFVMQGIGMGACVGSSLVNMTADSEPKHWQTITNGAPYHYIISWIEGCTSTESKQNMYKPLKDDEKTNCVNLLEEDYTKCNNGGVGGWRDAGCLRYEFKAQVDE